MSDIKKQVREQNPWWKNSNEIQDDRHIKQYRESSFQWNPPVMEEISLQAGQVQTLRGPRQVGKTTALKRTIKRLLENEEKRLFYFSFDLMNVPEDIVQVIRTAKQMYPDSDGGWYIFLDEITTVDEWAQGVKYLQDQGLTSNDYLLITGSSARDLREGAELLPGRRGGGGDLLMLPMSFRHFCEINEHDFGLPDALSLSAFLSSDCERACKQLQLRSDTLSELFNIYMRIGGFPAAVRDYLDQGEVTSQTVRLIWDTIAGDITAAGKKRESALKLLEVVSTNLASPFVWSRAGEDINVHPDTAKSYVRLLSETFSFMTVYFWDLSGKTFRPVKSRKVYFMDPLFEQIPPIFMPGARRADENALRENLVAVGLFRSESDVMIQADPVPGAVHTWRSKSGREVDFMIRGEHPPIMVEVKGDNKTQIANARRAIKQTFDRGLIVTDSVFSLEDRVPTIPAYLFLALLEEIPERIAERSIQ